MGAFDGRAPGHLNDTSIIHKEIIIPYDHRRHGDGCYFTKHPIAIVLFGEGIRHADSGLLDLFCQSCLHPSKAQHKYYVCTWYQGTEQGINVIESAGFCAETHRFCERKVGYQSRGANM